MCPIVDAKAGLFPQAVVLWGTGPEAKAGASSSDRAAAPTVRLCFYRVEFKEGFVVKPNTIGLAYLIYYSLLIGGASWLSSSGGVLLLGKR